VVLEHNSPHQAERYSVCEYPTHLIGIFEWSKPFPDGDYGQEKNEGKKIYNTGAMFAYHAMLRGIRLFPSWDQVTGRARVLWAELHQLREAV
jgi:hypothetical protein